MTIRRPTGTVAAALASGLVIAGCLTARQVPDPRGRGCGFPSSANIVAQFEMSPAADYRQHFPAVDELPELDQESRPAFVVVVAGPVLIGDMVSKREYNGAVCILVGDVPNVYPELDTSGFRQ